MVETTRRFASYLRCPRCLGELRHDHSALSCVECSESYPVLDGIPVLLNEDNSIFRIEDFVNGAGTFFGDGSRFRRLSARLSPMLARNVVSEANFRRLLAELGPTDRRVLVVGGSVLGQGMDVLAGSDAELVETDVAFGPRTRYVADAHDLPFADQTFDAVVAQAVLEHVVDPHRCISEFERVLKPRGLIYAEVPFMQPVHGGPYDFTRFSKSGLRWLCRRFDELAAGVVCGPASSLAYSCVAFAQALGPTALSSRVLGRLARYGVFWLRYADELLARTPSAVGGASSLFFLGRRSESELSPRDLLTYYRTGRTP
jgi:SAM-dependent methyltransferase